MNYDAEFLSAALKMALALAAVLAAVWALGRLLKGPLALGRGRGGALLRMRAALPLGTKKQIALVEVPGAVLVLGIAPDRITPLDRISDEALLQQIRDAGNSGSGTDFKTLLRRAGSGDTEGGRLAAVSGEGARQKADGP